MYMQSEAVKVIIKGAGSTDSLFGFKADAAPSTEFQFSRSLMNLPAN
jgi:hypothetical protein